MGMSKTEVMAIMGKPEIYESYENLNGKQVDILFYSTIQLEAGVVRKDECTPVMIENGRLNGFGDEFYESRRRVDVHLYDE